MSAPNRLPLVKESMRLLVGCLHMQYLVANLLAIAAGSLANFFISDLLVFRRAPTAEK